MDLLNVSGLPLAKLKENHVVIVLRKRQEFEKLARQEFEKLVAEENTPIFIDDQKVYFFKGKNCFVFFYNSKTLFSERGEQNVDSDK